MKALIYMTVATSLAGLFGPGPRAEAREWSGTERQVVEILKDISSRRSQNPMFRCYHLGRLKGVADRLSRDIGRLSAQTSKSPSRQAERIYAGQRLHLKLERQIGRWGYDCDPLLAQSAHATIGATGSLVGQVQFARRKILGIGAEDPVIGCFQAGRLEILTARLRRDLRDSHARGDKVDARTHDLLNKSLLTLRAKAKGCDAF